MKSLKTILSTVLINVVEAQHEANRYSAQLAERYYRPTLYGENVNLSHFPTPNSVINDIELTLNVEPKDITNKASSIVGSFQVALIEVRTLINQLLGIASINIPFSEEEKHAVIKDSGIQLLIELLADNTINRQILINELTKFLTKLFIQYYERYIPTPTNKARTRRESGTEQGAESEIYSNEQGAEQGTESEVSSDKEGKKQEEESELSSNKQGTEFEISSPETTTKDIETIKRAIQNIIRVCLEKYLPNTLLPLTELLKDITVNYDLTSTKEKELGLWNIKLNIGLREFSWGKTEDKSVNSKDPNKTVVSRTLIGH